MNHTFKFSRIYLVICAKSYLGLKPQCSLASVSSKKCGQLSAIVCLNASTLYSISNFGICFLIYSAIYLGQNDIPEIL